MKLDFGGAVTLKLLPVFTTTFTATAGKREKFSVLTAVLSVSAWWFSMKKEKFELLNDRLRDLQHSFFVKHHVSAASVGIKQEKKPKCTVGHMTCGGLASKKLDNVSTSAVN